MTLRRRNTVPPNMLLSSIASWGDGVMAPPFLPLRHYAPSQVTEDTPPDLLEGTMDLEVTLPNGKAVVMSVHRSTPMMDLLIQVTTAHRINPGGHVIQVISDNIFLTYKPSTPIGTLDTNAIKIVSKNALNEMTKARKSNLQQEAIERNIRLKPKEWVYKQQLVVNLPRNQLAVYRVPPKSLISEIFTMVCEDKNLDPETHEIRHPANVDERLRGSCSLSDYQLQEVCIVSSDFRPPPLSVTDLITMSSIAHPEDKKRRGIFGIFSRKAKSSTGDSSVSSGSAGERSVSPARSDESVEGRPTSQAQSPTSSSTTLTNVYHKSNISGDVTMTSNDRNSLNSADSTRISRPVSMISLNKTKKRPAPVPPQRVKRTTDDHAVNEKINTSKEKTNLSRHNSDSSGYHEQERKSLQTSPSCSEVGSIDTNRSVLRPTSNLTSVSNSSSTTSVKVGKRKAPSPPKPSIIRNGRTSPSSIPENPEGNETKQILEVCEETTTNGESSHVSVTESSENLAKEAIDQSDHVKSDSSQMNISENFNNLENTSESTSSESKLQTIDTGHIMQDANTENSVSEQTALIVAEEVNEANHNEIPKASVVEPCVEKTALKSSDSPVVSNSSSSSSPPLVASESEVKTRNVDLSSENSHTGIEMLNPKDIQRPKRHRRKKIPEVFMRDTVSIGSTVSNDSTPTAGSDQVDNVSLSLQQPKNFESVHKEMEGIEVVPKSIENTSAEVVCSDGFEEMDPRTDAQSDLEIVSERLREESSKEVPKDSHSVSNNKNAQLSVIYIEDLNEEESTTDPLTPPTTKKKKFTTKLQLSTEDEISPAAKDENYNTEPQLLTTTEINLKNSNKSSNCNSKILKSCQEDVMAELKSAIENPDANSDHRPIILNLKQKEKRDWDIAKPSEYNLILNINKKGGDSCSSDSTFVRSASASSYESLDRNSLRKSSPSTVTSYESVPPPLPDSQIPQPSDYDSKASSLLSLESSFSDQENAEFTKPNAPAFSISTYESRASKLSYNKKLSRSGSLASFKDIQSNEFSPSDERKLNRSDSQRNEVFRSDNLKKKCTSTTFLNLSSNKDADDEKISFDSNIRPSLIKSRSRPSLFESSADSTDINNDMSRTIQFDVSSSKEPITFTRPLPFKTYNNLRKAKSQLDIRNENRMAEGFQGIPDSGLANEYMRLQDDFVKWQQQLLQNQQLLHNRVAPIAANPPVLNNAGRIGGGLRLGWKPPTPWLVNNMLHQSTPAAPQQQRKPVEITIPIRLVDSDEEDASKAAQPKPQPQPQPKPVLNQTAQRNTQPQQVNTPSSSRWNGPNVSIDSWQERPSYVIVTQPTVIEPSAPRHFANQPRMQTVFQSTPNEWQDRETVVEKPVFQQKPQSTQQRQQNIVTPPQQNVPMPEFYPMQRQAEETVIHPQQNVSRPEFYQVNQPKPNFTQEPQSHFRQMPQANFQEVPQQNHFRNENSQEQSQNFEPHQPIYNQTRVYNNTSAPESNAIKFSEQNTPFATRSFPQNFNRPQQVVPPPVVDKGDDGIDARFSSVVTLSNDKNDQNVPQKDKVRSVVQLNNSNPQIGVSPVPFSSKIINSANKVVNNKECDGPVSFQPSDTSSVAPMSSRLVQQAVQQPYVGSRISPPKVEQRYSPPKFEQRSSPPKIEQYYQTPTLERQPSPPNSEPSLPFGEVKLRHVESPRVSPPKLSAPEPFVAAPPPPPPPPSRANAGPPAPPPPPPPVMSEADRRAATGKKILGAAYTPQLDAREELMMAIRQFGGSQNLRKSAHPPPH